MVRLFLAVSGVLSLFACMTEPRISNPAPPGVSYRFTGDDIGNSNVRADRYCAQFGKRAHLSSVRRGGAENIANYECS